VENTHTLARTVPIAGNYEASHGRGLNPTYQRLKDSPSHTDAQREGVRVEFHGGRYPDTRKGTDQKAIIEFECDRERTGLEGLEGKEEEEEKEKRKEGDDEDDDGDEEGDSKASLKFVSYKLEGPEEEQLEVLRLLWRTKYACESVDDEPSEGSNKKAGWGWFTWLLIM